jgi:hypothetical protein
MTYRTLTGWCFLDSLPVCTYASIIRANLISTNFWSVYLLWIALYNPELKIYVQLQEMLHVLSHWLCLWQSGSFSNKCCQYSITELVSPVVSNILCRNTVMWHCLLKGMSNIHCEWQTHLQKSQPSQVSIQRTQYRHSHNRRSKEYEKSTTRWIEYTKVKRIWNVYNGTYKLQRHRTYLKIMEIDCIMSSCVKRIIVNPRLT